MPDGEYKLAVQRNERAYYAKVRLEIDHDGIQREAVIEFAPESSPNNADWAIAARFGINYVLEALPMEQRGVRWASRQPGSPVVKVCKKHRSRRGF